jgi:glutathione synthase/RimK-type ligase-like ATP-grasp enzyme
MLFILTSAEDATASFLVDRLSKGSVPLLRLDTDSIVSRSRISYRLREPILEIEGTAYQPADVTHVWYRRPEKLQHRSFGASPEGEYTRQEWTEAIEGFFAHVPKFKWMNHPTSNAAASHKLQQLTTASALGFTVPDTVVTQDARCLREFFYQHGGRVIVKPMASGYVERVADTHDSLIYTNRVVEEHLADLSDLSGCPTMFQEYVMKQHDVRVTVVDDDIYAVALTADDNGAQRCDIRRNNMSDVVYHRVQLPLKIARAVRQLVHTYELRFAAIDFAVSTEGEWYFFEINPNGQWAWLEMCANVRISDSFLKSFRQ